MDKRRSGGVWILLGFAVVIACRWNPGWAEITVDGSLGGPSGPLAKIGNEFRITENLGQLHGSNLFHSFGIFNLGNGEIANFTGNSPVENILARVTGGNPSQIDGTIRTLDYPGANLYLINPSGLMFGPNAKLDVNGAFYATTADYIGLADSGRFDATTPSNSVLTTAPPAAFGFLGENPAGITVQGSLSTPEGETLSVVSGDLQISAGTLSAPNGRIDIASVGSTGEVVPSDDDLNVESIDRFGEIDVSNGSLIATTGEGGGIVFVRGGELVLSGGSGIEADTQGSEDSGGVDVKAESVGLTGNGTFISANTFGEGDGGNLSVEASRITIAGEESSSGLFAFADSDSGTSGNAGDITINTDNLEMRNGRINAETFPDSSGNGGDITINSDNVELNDSRITSGTGGDGDAGKITLDVNTLQLRNGAAIWAPAFSNSSGDAGKITLDVADLKVGRGSVISTSPAGEGDGGNLVIKADNVLLTGQDETEDFTLITAATRSSGKAGDLTIKTEDLEVRSGGQILAGTFAEGQGGKLSVEADTVLLSRDGSEFITGIFNSVSSDATGDAGELIIKAGSLEVRNGAEISASSFGDGQGGNGLIEADTVLLSKDGGVGTTGIFANAQGSGDGGNLTIKVGGLQVRNGAEISAGTSSSEGDGGNMLLEADSIFLSGDGADTPTGIFAQAQFSGTGDAGNITIKTGSLEIRNGAAISASTFTNGQGGDALIEADNTLVSRDGAETFTGISMQTQGSGDGGSLTLKSAYLEVRDDGEISAATFSRGLGGNVSVESDSVLLVGNGEDSSATITVTADVGSNSTAGDLTIKTDSLELRSGATISASSDSGQGGDLLVEADRVHLSGEGGGFTGITTNAGRGNTVRGGNLTINTRILEVIKEAVISSGTFGFAQAGEIFITADEIALRDGGRIRARSTATDLDTSNDPDVGRSGNIFINARNSLQLFNNSDISVETAQANAGSIILQVGDLLHLRDGSSVTTSVAEGKGNGGNIRIDPVFVVLDSSDVTANAFQGAGGNIRIITDYFLASPDSQVTASSALGIDGQVEISSPETDIAAGLQALPASFLDVARIMTTPCAQRSGADVIRLVAKKYEVLPQSPHALRVYLPVSEHDTERTEGFLKHATHNVPAGGFESCNQD